MLRKPGGDFARRMRVRVRRRTRPNCQQSWVEHPGRVQRGKCSHIRVRGRDLAEMSSHRGRQWTAGTTAACRDAFSAMICIVQKCRTSEDSSPLSPVSISGMESIREPGACGRAGEGKMRRHRVSVPSKQRADYRAVRGRVPWGGPVAASNLLAVRPRFLPGRWPRPRGRR